MNVDTTVIRPSEFELKIFCDVPHMNSAWHVARALRGIARRIESGEFVYGQGGYALDGRDQIVGSWWVN